jgi:hypothetical protein
MCIVLLPPGVNPIAVRYIIIIIIIINAPLACTSDCELLKEECTVTFLSAQTLPSDCLDDY